MIRFKLYAYEWNLLSKLEPKASVETFITPKYSANDYAIIRKVLSSLWPKETVK